MTTLKMILMVLTMALVTYIIRMLPFVCFRKKIKSAFINSLLYYIPYTVLGAMTFPYIFYSTNNFFTALIGTAIAIILATFKRPLIVVALLSCISVFVFGFII